MMRETLDVTVREAEKSDAAACGRICFDAFSAVASAHNFSPDVPSVEVATGLVTMMLGNEGFYKVVAEQSGTIVGSNFLDERNPISGVGPVTVDPRAQNREIGRRLMLAVMERSERRGFLGIRLLQAGYHCRSLALYSKLGFEVREHVACMQGRAIGANFPGYAVRPAIEEDVAACNRLCLHVHGHNRGGELRDAIRQGQATVVERGGRITGYTTLIAFFGHAVAETNDDLTALIAAARSFEGPGFLVPSRNGELMRWCFANGLRMTQPLTLMTLGLYNEPVGPYLPSILY
ncbi:MAG TPA: GNAT family N-acetyltransferase [Candidatus Baltobacteraceae bacterium]|jgi:GNAT superfamily N-acetyltransferase|nr:GNAT family N-acetyltransferase [Candidatus Baltobacteraceae bacterium]